MMFRIKLDHQLFSLGDGAIWGERRPWGSTLWPWNAHVRRLRWRDSLYRNPLAYTWIWWQRIMDSKFQIMFPFNPLNMEVSKKKSGTIKIHWLIMIYHCTCRFPIHWARGSHGVQWALPLAPATGPQCRRTDGVNGRTGAEDVTRRVSWPRIQQMASPKNGRADPKSCNFVISWDTWWENNRKHWHLRAFRPSFGGSRVVTGGSPGLPTETWG